MNRLVLMAALLILIGGSAYGDQEREVLAGNATIKDANGQPVGSAMLSQGPQGVTIAVDVSRLPPGRHGIHIHAAGKCDPPDFKSAGGHFNPSGKKHGLKNTEGAHAGDLPNLEVGPGGKGKLEGTIAGATLGKGDTASLFGPGGAAVVIHADPDDEMTDPAGNSGARIACGVIEKSSYRAGLISTPDAAQLYYESRGEGLPVLLVHGWLGSTSNWSRNVDVLAKHFRVVTMDLRAHGNSSKILQGHNIPQYAQDVRTVIEALKLKKVALVGHSMGGPVLLEYWKRFGPDKIGALGLVDINPFLFSAEAWNGSRLRNHNFDGMNAFMIAFQEDRKETSRKFLKGIGIPEEDIEGVLKEMLKTPTPAAVAAFSDFPMRDYTGVLKTISVPTIVWAGKSTSSPKGIETGKYVSGQIPNAKFVPVEEGGHVIQAYAADRFNSSLIEFLNEVK